MGMTVSLTGDDAGDVLVHTLVLLTEVGRYVAPRQVQSPVSLGAGYLYLRAPPDFKM
jgi:hypothetical protein